MNFLIRAYQTDVVKNSTFSHHAQRLKTHVEGLLFRSIVTLSSGMETQQKTQIYRLREFGSFTESSKARLVGAL